MSMYEYYEIMQRLCCRCASLWKVMGDRKQADYYSKAEDEIIRKKRKLTFMVGISHQDSKTVKQLEQFSEEVSALQRLAFEVLEAAV